MNRRYNILSIAAVAVIAATLFGSTYSQTQVGSTYSLPKTQSELMQKINDVGGLQLQMPEAFAQIPLDQVDAMKAQGRNVVEFNVEGMSAELPIMGGGTYHAMTFSGQVPGPTLRVTQGDIVKMTLTVSKDEPTPHGNDMHASQMTAVPSFGAVKPGESKTYAYIAQVAGTFKYHCSGVNVAAMDQHVLSGMYGMTIVDPLNGYNKLMVEKTKVDNGKVVKDRIFYDPAALEFTLQYNQLYLDDKGNYDQSKMFMHHQTATVVNGMQFGYVPNAAINKLITKDENKNIFVVQPWNSADLKQYQSQLIFVPTGTHTRWFVENQGNEPVFFHIVGEIIDRVMQGNRVQAQGTETWLIGGSQGAIIDVVFDEPGAYVAVNHDYAAIFTGAATVIIAGDPFSLGYKPGDMPNPSDAVPPMGKDSMAQKLVLHGLYTDARAAEIAAMIKG